MTLVFIGKGLVLEGSTTKIEDKQVPGVYIHIYIYPQWQFSFGEERLKLFFCWNKFRHGKLIRFDLMALIVWVG